MNDIATTPTISHDRAETIARSLIKGDSISVEETELIYYPLTEADVLVLAWQVRVSSMQEDVTYFIDAMEGSTLHSVNNLDHYGDFNASDRSFTTSVVKDKLITLGTEAVGYTELGHFLESEQTLVAVTISGQVNGTYWPEEDTDPTTTSGYETTTIKLYNEYAQYLATISTNSSGYYSKTYSMAPGIYILHFYLEGNYVQVKNGSNNVPYDQKVVALGSGTNVINHTWSANDRSNVRQHVLCPYVAVKRVSAETP